MSFGVSLDEKRSNQRVKELNLSKTKKKKMKFHPRIHSWDIPLSDRSESDSIPRGKRVISPASPRKTAIAHSRKDSSSDSNDITPNKICTRSITTSKTPIRRKPARRTLSSEAINKNFQEDPHQWQPSEPATNISLLDSPQSYNNIQQILTLPFSHPNKSDSYPSTPNNTKSKWKTFKNPKLVEKKNPLRKTITSPRTPPSTPPDNYSIFQSSSSSFNTSIKSPRVPPSTPPDNYSIFQSSSSSLSTSIKSPRSPPSTPPENYSTPQLSLIFSSSSLNTSNMSPRLTIKKHVPEILNEGTEEKEEERVSGEWDGKGSGEGKGDLYDIDRSTLDYLLTNYKSQSFKLTSKGYARLRKLDSLSLAIEIPLSFELTCPDDTIKKDMFPIKKEKSRSSSPETFWKSRREKQPGPPNSLNLSQTPSHKIPADSATPTHSLMPKTEGLPLIEDKPTTHIPSIIISKKSEKSQLDKREEDKTTTIPIPSLKNKPGEGVVSPRTSLWRQPLKKTKSGDGVFSPRQTLLCRQLNAIVPLPQQVMREGEGTATSTIPTGAFNTNMTTKTGEGVPLPLQVGEGTATFTIPTGVTNTNMTTKTGEGVPLLQQVGEGTATSTIPTGASNTNMTTKTGEGVPLPQQVGEGTATFTIPTGATNTNMTTKTGEGVPLPQQVMREGEGTATSTIPTGATNTNMTTKTGEGVPLPQQVIRQGPTGATNTNMTTKTGEGVIPCSQSKENSDTCTLLPWENLKHCKPNPDIPIDKDLVDNMKNSVPEINGGIMLREKKQVKDEKEMELDPNNDSYLSKPNTSEVNNRKNAKLAGSPMKIPDKNPKLLPLPHTFDPLLHDEKWTQVHDNYKTLTLTPSMGEYQRVIQLMNLSTKIELSKYKVKSIRLIWNKNLQRMFEGEIKILSDRATLPEFQPSWNTDPNPDLRSKIINRFKHYVSKIPQPYTPANLVPLWHGCKSTVVHAICTTGLAALQSTDQGYFGKGLYCTNSWKYAAKVYSTLDMTLVMCWTVIGNPYPVIGSDNFGGLPAFKNYDTHYVPVQPVDPLNPHEVLFVACEDLSKVFWDEYVLFKEAQVLPRYVVQLEYKNEEDNPPTTITTVPTTKDPKKWNCDEVCGWLSTLNLTGDYKSSVYEHGIDGDVLFDDLITKDPEKWERLGFKAYGDVSKIMRTAKKIINQ